MRCAARPAEQVNKLADVANIVNSRDGNNDASQQSKDGSQDVKGNQPLGLQQQQTQAL
jgi:hypothetical protein